MRRPPYYTNYSRSRLLIHNVVTSKYFDLAIAAVIGLNVVTMAMEFYLMPPVSWSSLILFIYFFFNKQQTKLLKLYTTIWNAVGTGVCFAHFQLFLHGRLHHRIRLQSGGPGSETVHQGPLESAGRFHRHPVHWWHRFRGNEIRFNSNQSHHHSRHASPSDSQRWTKQKTNYKFI